MLRPASVDPSSEYRFYIPEQLPRLNRIVVLKDLGFSLQQLAALLADDPSSEQIKGMLKLRRAEAVVYHACRPGFIQAEVAVPVGGEGERRPPSGR